MAITSPGSVANFRVANHRVTWNSVVLGLTAEGSEITIEKIFRERTADQYGQTVLDKHLVGEKVSVKLTLKEFTAATLGKVLPGSTTTTGLVEDGVQYAGSTALLAGSQALVLHALDQDDATLSYDWQFFKSYPVISGPIVGRADQDAAIQVEFHVFPDTSKAIGKQLYKYGA